MNKRSQPSSRRHFLKASAQGTAMALMLPTLSAHATQEEWGDLFDGESLDGWRPNPKKIGHGSGGRWLAEEGSITGQQDPPGSGNGGILLTDRQFSNFELLIDMKPDWGVCSGLFLRSTKQGQCFQMMVDYHDAGNIGHIYGEGSGGFNTRAFDIDGVYEDGNLKGLASKNHKTADTVGLVHSCKPEEFIRAWKLDDWNTARVRVLGEHPRITTWINGLTVCVFDGATSNNAAYNKDEVLKTLGPKGSIAVQVHGGGGWPNGAKCRWKNIRVREL